MVQYAGNQLNWLGYATARIEEGDTVIYTDPGRFGVLTGEWIEKYGDEMTHHPHGQAYSAMDGDLVVVTHDHHYDDDGIERVASDNASIIVYEEVSTDRIAENSGRAVRDPESLPYDVTRVSYGDTLIIDGVTVEVVPAYNNLNGPNVVDGSPIHPRGYGCGFLITLGDRTILWTGDSDIIDEHYGLNVSILLPSIAQSLTMDRYGAVELATELQPELVLPIHYNTFPKLRADSDVFATDVARRGIPVVLDEHDFI